MTKTPLENLKEYKIVEIQDVTLKNNLHPFKDDSILLNNSFYFLRKKNVEQAEKIISESHKLHNNDFDIISWAFQVGDLVKQSNPEGYTRQHPTLMLSRRAPSEIKTNPYSYISYTLMELFFLDKAVKFSWKTSRARRDGFCIGKENPFYSKINSENHSLHEIYVNDQPNIILGWVPKNWLPSFTRISATDPMYRFTGENRDRGRIKITHLEELGLVEINEGKQIYTITPLAQLLINAWHLWIANLALDAGLNLPSKLEQQLQNFQKRSLNFKLLSWLTSDENHQKFTIKSFSTRKRVNYSSLYVKEIKEERPKTVIHEERITALDFINQDKEGIKIIIGVPGSGKSTILKKRYESSLNIFLEGKKSEFPIIIPLKNITEETNLETWLDEEIFSGFYNIFREIIEEGKIEFLADAWDEVPPDRRSKVEFILNNISEKGNRLIITSRKLQGDSYPKLNKEMKSVEVSPFTYKEVDEFLRSRRPHIKNEDLKLIKGLLQRSRIELIPLWLDVIARYDKIGNDDLDELSLLSHWVNQAETYANDLIINIDEIEKLAFESYRDRGKINLTTSFLRILISSKSIILLRKHGWLVPAGFFKGEQRFNFVHERLREYLSARYIWREWNSLEKEIFDRKEGILSQKDREILIELAIREGSRIIPKSNVLAKRTYQIAGEQDWFIDDNIEASLLRDPFLASYLFSILEIPETKWINSLKEFLTDIWELFRQKDDHSRFLQSWVSGEYLLKTIYAVIPELVVSTIDSSHWFHDLNRLGLPISTVNNFLDICSTLVNESSKVAYNFFNFILWEHPLYSGRWKNFIQSFLEADPKDEFVSATMGALDILVKLDQNSAVAIMDNWITSPNESLRFPRIIYPYIQELHRSGSLNRLVKNWLQDSSLEVRKSIIHELVFLSKKSGNDLEEYIVRYIKEIDYPIWFDIVKRQETGWGKESRNKLIKWICDNMILKGILLELPIHKCPELLQLIKKHKPKLGTIKEEENALWMLGNQSIDDSELEDFGIDIKKFYESESYLLIKLNDPKIVYEDLILKTTNDERERVLDYAITACLDLGTEKCLNRLEEILHEDNDLSESILRYIWRGRNYHWWNKQSLLRFLPFVRNSKNSIIRIDFLCYLFELNLDLLEGKEYRQIVNYLIDSSESDVRYLACCLIEYFPESEQNNILDTLIENENGDLFSIALRILSINNGLNFYRVVQRGASSITKGQCRPVFIQTGISFSPGFFYTRNYGFIRIASINKQKEKENSSLLNFGLPQTFFNLYFKRLTGVQNYNTVLFLRQIPTSVKEAKIYNNIERNFKFDPIGTSKPTDLLLKTMRKGLTSSSDSIIFTSLLYLEDFSEKLPALINSLKSCLKKLSSHDHVLVRGYAQYLLWLTLPKSQLIQFKKGLKAEKIDIVSFWWGFGRREDGYSDKVLLEEIRLWRENDPLHFLETILPFIFKSKRIYLTIWDKIIEIYGSQSYYEGEIGMMSPFHIDSRIRFLHRSLVYLLKLEQPIFPRWVQEAENNKWVDVIIKEISPIFSLNSSDVNFRLNKLTQCKDKLFQYLGKSLYVSLGLRDIHEFISDDLSNSTISEINFLYFYRNNLGLHLQIKLLDEMISRENYAGLALVAIEELPIPEVLPLITKALNTIEKPLNLLYNEIRDTWLKIAEELLRNHYQKTLEWLTTIPCPLPLYFLPRELLEQMLLDLEDIPTQEAKKLHGQIFTLLYPKLWYTVTDFWDEILRIDEH